MTPKQAMHTPTPWRIYKEPMNPNPRIMAEASTLVAVISQGKAFAKQTDTNAAFVVRACNAHEDLLGALKAIRARLDGDFDNPHLMKFGTLGNAEGDIGTIASDAIAKAEASI